MVKLKVINFLRHVRNTLVWVCSTNRVLSRVFFLFSGEFDREFDFTLKGRYDALTHKYSSSNSNANIRRCVHRLEKGLFHQKPKKYFGEAVFKELRKEIQKYDLTKMDKNEMKWLINTLKSYTSFSRTPHKVQLLTQSLKSYSEQNNNNDKSSIKLTQDFDSLKKIISKRKSVRFYKPKTINIDKIAKCVEIAKLAPTACNRQPYHIELLTNKKDILEIGNLAPGTSGWIDGVPALGVVIGHSNSFRFSRDRHLIYFDSGLFVSNFINSLVTLELASCICNWTPSWNADRKAVKYVGYDLSKTIICLIAIGSPEHIDSPVSTKKSTENILRIRNEN